jgi:hypothetical protein
MAEPEQKPKYSRNNKSSVYDDQGSTKSVAGSGLRHQERSAGDGVPPTSSVSPASSLKTAESDGGFYNKSADLGGKVASKAAAAAGPEMAVAQRTIQRIIGTFSRHKGGAAAGGGAILVSVLVVILGAGFVVSHEIITLEKTFIKYEMKIEQHFEKKASNKLLQKMICLQAQTCKKGTDDGADEDPAAENGDANPNPTSNEALANEMKDIDLTSKPVAAALDAQGIEEVKGPSGNLEELKDTSTGADVTDDVATDTNGVADSIASALPAEEYGQETSFRADVVEHAGVNEDPSPAADPDDTDKAIEDNVLKGATEEEIAGEAAITDSNKGTNESAANYSEGVAEGGALGQELSAADKGIDNAEPEPAVEEGVEDINVGDPVFLSSTASTLCSIDNLVTKSSDSRVPKIDTLLIRHGMLLVSLADELKVGDLSGGALNKVMSIFNGNSSAKPTIDPTTGKSVPDPSSYPLSDSEAYQSASGNSGGIAMDDSSLPTENDGSKILGTVNGLLDKTVVGPMICKAEGTIFGTVLNAFGNTAQIFETIASGGLSEVATIAANLALFAEIQHTVIPEILKYFTVVGLDGLENAAQWGNNAGAGLNLASNDYARSIGANPVTTPVASQIASEATQEQNIAQSRLSWVDRTVALSNPDSLASHLLMDMPVGLAATINGAINSLVKLPATLIHTLSSIFSTRAQAAAVPADPGEAAGVTQYAFTDSELGQYDPISNEAYLFTPVTFVDKLDNINAMVAHRIDALGNPNTDLLNGSGNEVDSSGNLITDDLLHCYVDNYVDLQENTLTGAGGTPSSGISIAQDCMIPGSNGNYSLGDYDYTTNTPADASTIDSTLDTTIASIYCYHLLYPNNLTVTILPKCMQQIVSQVKDDIGHFRQYILDVHVMKDYEGVLTNQ